MRTLIIGICLLVLLQSCYKDKGNYDYTDLNKITVSTEKDTFNVLLYDTLKINLSVAQTMPVVEGLDFKWTLYQITGAPLTRNTVGTSQNLAARMTDAPGAYYLQLVVTDKNTQIQTLKKFVVNIVGKYNEGWLVLEESTGGADISMITPIDVVFHNTYSESNEGAKLPAGSHRITVVQDRTNVQKIYVMSPNDAFLLYYANFVKLSSLNDWFWAPPATPKPQEYFISGSTDERIFMDGKPYGINTINGAGQKFGLPPSGTYNMAPFSIYSVSTNYIWFDKIQQRFYKQNGNTFDLSAFAAPTGANPFDMNNVGRELLYAESNVGSLVNCLVKKNGGDSLFIYQLDLSKANPATTIYKITNAPGLATATKFAMSRFLPHMYYVSDNKIYLLDILAESARVVYTFPAGTEVRAFKMYYNSKVTADPDNYRLLGVATMEGSTNKVYQFPISATGDFTNNTYRKVFTGFGKINDIAFKRIP